MIRVPEVRPTEAYDTSPSPVDDTPYIRYALDQLTREENSASESSYPVDRLVPDQGLGYVHSIKRVEPPTMIDIASPWRADGLRADKSPGRTSTTSNAKLGMYIPIAAPHDSTRYPDLMFKPTILRPTSITILMTLCLIMITALMFCAIYSTKNDGLATYDGDIYRGFYFVFRFLPQLLAAILFLYFQCLNAALSRIMPYLMMAGESDVGRAEAIFTRLYPNHWLPRFDLIRNGQAFIGASTVLTWPILFSIPLQSSLFSVWFRNGAFRWATVQGVAWTLVAIYFLAFAGLILTLLGLRSRTTGLLWDATSLADIVCLISRSNHLGQFANTEVLADLGEIRNALPPRVDRLGFWKLTGPGSASSLFHAFGEEGSFTRRFTVDRGKVVPSLHKSSFDAIKQELNLPESPIGGRAIPHYGTNSSLLAKVYSPDIRFRHIPRALADANIILYPLAVLTVFIVVLAVSFNTQTSITKGFRPLVSDNVNSAAFSPAAFLYSFLPSLLGMLAYLGLSSLALQLCILTPWAEMNGASVSDTGATPQCSLLLDYAYSISTPFATLKASLRNKHYVVAAFSIVLPLSLLLPILGGGFLFPLLAMPSGTLLIFPNLAAYYIILVVVAIILLLLISIPIMLLRRSNRLAYRLPHGVNTLAEIITFLYASHILEDATFKNVRGHTDLTARLLTSSGTLSSNETTSSAFTGDNRLSSSRYQGATAVEAPNAVHTRREARGTWDPEKWGGGGGWTRRSDLSDTRAKTRMQHASYGSSQSRFTAASSLRNSQEPRYSTEAGDWSAWDKEMGLTNLGGVVHGSARLSDVVRHGAHSGIRQSVASDMRPDRNRNIAALTGNGLSMQPGGNGGKRYFLGIFRGRDGRSHFGIERLGREEDRDAHDGIAIGARHERNESRFSV